MLSTPKPSDLVISAKLDHTSPLAPSALDVLAKPKALGVSLYMIDLGGAVSSNEISRPMFTTLATVKADQRQRGRYLGGIMPFGMTVGKDGALMPDQAKLALLLPARQI